MTLGHTNNAVQDYHTTVEIVRSTAQYTARVSGNNATLINKNDGTMIIGPNTLQRRGIN